MESKDFKDITFKIVFTTGKDIYLTIDTNKTFEDLKNKILEFIFDNNFDDLGINKVEDFNLILNGRILRNEKDKIYSLINYDNPTIFVNMSKIHGGCCPNYCVQK